MRIEDCFEKKSRKVHAIEGRIFEKTEFNGFSPIPPLGVELLISNTVFRRCKVYPTVFSLLPRVVLENVTFIDFDCPRPMKITAESRMTNVVIQGKRFPRELTIKPLTDGVGERRSLDKGQEGISLDLTDYHGELTVLGLDVSRMRISSSRHVRINPDRFKAANLPAIGIPPTSTWFFAAVKVNAAGAAEGVFSVLSPKSKCYEESMKQLEILRNEGVVD